MDGDRDAVARRLEGGKLASARYPTQQLLVAAIRRGEERAIYELFILYAPLLRDQARKMSVPADELSPLVDTLMADVALHLAVIDVPPRELTRYLVSAVRNRARTRHRDARRRESTSEAAYAEYGESRERIVAECHSEYGLRSALPSDESNEVPLRSVISKLAEKSAAELGADEILMMVGVGRHLPLRDIAEELGVTYGAARVRLSRLRERFIKLAIQYGRTLSGAERKEIARFFRRADVSLEAADGSKERHRKSQIDTSTGTGDDVR